MEHSPLNVYWDTDNFDEEYKELRKDIYDGALTWNMIAEREKAAEAEKKDPYAGFVAPTFDLEKAQGLTVNPSPKKSKKQPPKKDEKQPRRTKPQDKDKESVKDAQIDLKAKSVEG